MAKGQEYLQNVIANLHVQIAVLVDQVEVLQAENAKFKEAQAAAEAPNGDHPKEVYVPKPLKAK